MAVTSRPDVGTAVFARRRNRRPESHTPPSPTVGRCTVGDHRFRAQFPPFRPRSTRSTLKFAIFRTVSTSSREPDGRFRRAGGARWALKWPLLRVRTSERPFSPVCGLVVRRPPHHPHPPK